MITAIKKPFSHPHIVLPVIHVASEAQALRNASIAREAGADGVFLIKHAITSGELLRIHTSVAVEFPGWWIGVNCLDLTPAEVFTAVTNQVNGVWTDNALIEETSRAQSAAQRVLEIKTRKQWQGLYFGGVAFKYQRHVEDLRAAAQIARNYMDVVTTSGPGTGQAAHVEKIRTMKEALGDFPLAIASGITPKNVGEYLPYSDCYMVATGISKDFEELDPALTKQVVEVVRAYDTMQKQTQ